uniref:NGFI-A-binding protein 1-like n=1 Tax=Myxine glutinosa TaxID=7769 RepID=UPI00358EBF19
MPSVAPVTLGELQLYRVLQRANLLLYYETFVAQGGDDVQQLCNAAEDEFLEIMALVGMARKPLHVRRLQKALQEWVANPGSFSQPLGRLPSASIALARLQDLTPAAIAGPNPVSSALESQIQLAQRLPGGGSAGLLRLYIGPDGSPSLSGLPQVLAAFGKAQGAMINHPRLPLVIPTVHKVTPVHSAGQNGSRILLGSNTGVQVLSPADSGCRSADEGQSPPMSPLLLPTPHTMASAAEAAGGLLDEATIRALSECAETKLKGRTLRPPPSPAELHELLRSDRKQGKSLAHIADMTHGDPRRIEEIRKFSAIYGRFDSKRKDGRQLTLHEVTVNEAAAQLCLLDESLLVRRDELFPFARQVVRLSGYHFSHKPSKSKLLESAGYIMAKKGSGKMDLRSAQAELARLTRQERLGDIQERLRDIRRSLETLRQQMGVLEGNPTARQDEQINQIKIEFHRLEVEQQALRNEQAEIARKLREPMGGSSPKEQDEGEDDELSDSSMEDAREIDDRWNSELSQAEPLCLAEAGSQSCYKSTSQQTRQLVQQILMDEGLRLARQRALALGEALGIKRETRCPDNDHSDGGKHKVAVTDKNRYPSAEAAQYRTTSS